MSHEDRVLLQAASRCVLAGDRGTLAVQLDRLERAAGSRPAPRSPRRRLTDAGTRADRNGTTDAGPSKLLFDNGLGGFTPDGKEYVIRLAPPAQPAGRGKEAGGRRDAGGLAPSAIQYPPAPWANVVANPSFGFLVTERGGGCTWAGNSQTNRLTPWSNNPASDPPGEIVYLRDDATGEFWTPTPPLVGGAGPARGRMDPRRPIRPITDRDTPFSSTFRTACPRNCSCSRPWPIR